MTTAVSNTVGEPLVQNEDGYLSTKRYLVFSSAIDEALTGNTTPAMKQFLVGLNNTKTISGRKDMRNLTKESVLTTYCGLDSATPVFTVKQIVDCYTGTQNIFSKDDSYVKKFLTILQSLGIRYFNGSVGNNVSETLPEAIDGHQPAMEVWTLRYHNEKLVSNTLRYSTPGYSVTRDIAHEEKEARKNKDEYRSSLREQEREKEFNWNHSA